MRVHLLLLFATLIAAPLSAQQQPPLPPPYNTAPPDIQAIARRSLKGETISAADSIKVETFARRATLASFAGLPPDVQALMQKSLNGGKLTDAEQKRVSQAVTTDQLKKANLPADVKAMIDDASSGRKSTAQVQQEARTRMLADGRAAGARVTAALNPCPDVATVALPTLLTTLPQLNTLLRDIVATYTAQLGAPYAAMLGRSASNSGGAGLWMVGQVKPSILVFAEAALLTPTPRILNNLGAALNNDGDHRRAYLVLGAADRSAPGSAAVLTNLGVALAGMGQAEPALLELRSAMDVQPDLAMGRYDLSTVLRCYQGGGSREKAAAIDEAQLGQVDWFNAGEDQAIIAERAAEGMPVDGPDAQSHYTPKRPRLMSLGESDAVGVSPGGDVAKPPLPGSVEEYYALWTAGTFAKRMSIYAERARSWNAQAAVLASQYRAHRQAWLAGASADDIRIPVSDAAALTGLSRRRGAMLQAVGKSSALETQDLAAAARTMQGAWAAAVAAGGGVKAACTRLWPRATESYAIAKGAVSANANRVDMIMQDFASDAAAWINQIHSPLLQQAALDGIAADADNASAEAFGDAAVSLESVLVPVFCGPTQHPPPDVAVATSESAKQPFGCKLPKIPAISLGLGKLTVSCDGVGFAIDAGASVDAKWNSRTRSGSLFIGGGLKVPVGWDGPVTMAAKGATAAAGGAIDASGNAGMIFKFDGGTISDAGFEFGARFGDDKAHGGKGAGDYRVDITVVGGLQVSPDLGHALDGVADKLWGVDPGATTPIKAPVRPGPR